MLEKTTKKQRIVTGIACLPFALAIDALLVMSIYRGFVSGFKSMVEHWPVLVVFLLVGFLLTRSAYMLLRYPNGIKSGNLINPYIVLALCVFAMLACLAILVVLLVSPESFSDNPDFNFGKGLSSLLIAIPALLYAIKAQYNKIFNKALKRTP